MFLRKIILLIFLTNFHKRFQNVEEKEIKMVDLQKMNRWNLHIIKGNNL